MSDAPPDLSRLTIRRDDDAPRGGRARPRWLLPLVAVTLMAVAAAMIFARRGAAVEVRTALVEFTGGGGGGSILTANGYVVARTQASVASKIMGRLERLNVTEGSTVARGDILAQLDDRDYVAAREQVRAGAAAAEAALTEAEATRDQLRRDVDRDRQLLANAVISTREFETAESQLAAAEARVGSRRAEVGMARAAIGVADANLENTRIRAPFDGTVLRKDAEVGEVLAPAATGTGLTRGAVITMANLSTLEVEVDVNEGYIGRLRSDQPAKITLDAYPDTTFNGRVRQILPTAERERATVQVKVAILDRDPRVLPEMGARVDFIEPGSAAGAGTATGAGSVHVTVPAEAVHDESGHAVVWVVKDGVLSRHEVVAGPVSGGRREIRQGLSGGERVVTGVDKGDLKEGGQARVAAE